MTSTWTVSSGLFDAFTVGSLTTRNRFAMAPMTREFATDGVPSDEAAAYYARRARGGVGLIITEGTVIDHPASAPSARVPRFYGDDALSRWTAIVDAVHGEGGTIIPQLWHVGLDRDPGTAPHPDAASVGPGDWFGATPSARRTMGQKDIDEVIDAFARAAVDAQRLGFDGVELHGGHGYLIDQFLWARTNSRSDAYGGSIGDRSRFAAEIVAEIRHRVASDFPVVFRLSQWKTIDFDARPYATPHDLEHALSPLVEAGASMFHASTRRFWVPEYGGSTLNLAGWARKLTGVPTITVGSVGLEGSDFVGALLAGDGAEPASLARIGEMFEQGEFDLVALGRAVISDPDVVNKLQHGQAHARAPFDARDLSTLT